MQFEPWEAEFRRCRARGQVHPQALTPHPTCPYWLTAVDLSRLPGKANYTLSYTIASPPTAGLIACVAAIVVTVYRASFVNGCGRLMSLALRELAASVEGIRSDVLRSMLRAVGCDPEEKGKIASRIVRRKKFWLILLIPLAIAAVIWRVVFVVNAMDHTLSNMGD